MCESGGDGRKFFYGFREARGTYVLLCCLLIASIALAVAYTLLGGLRSSYWVVLGVAPLMVAAACLRRKVPKPPSQTTEATRAKRQRGGLAVAGIGFAINGALWTILAREVLQATLSGPLKVRSLSTVSQIAVLCVLAAPFVFFALALGQIPLWRRANRRLRRAEGKCEKCGYPLMGLPEPRCPECGTVSEPPPS
jgi:hypothetical protein